MNDVGDLDRGIAETTNHLVFALTLELLIVQAVARQRFYEPGGDIAALDAVWATGDLSDPVSVSHRVSRAVLEGIGDLLSALSRAFQEGPPLLVSTANLTRSVHEYSSRAAFLADSEVTVTERLARAAEMLHDGFDHVGGKNPEAHEGLKATSSPFYAWYKTKGRALSDGAKKSKKYGRSDRVFAETLGTAYKPGAYRDLSNYAHGNGPAVLGLYDAATRSDIAGPQWNAVIAMRWGFYALECAGVATRRVAQFTDPADRRSLREILPYRANVAALADFRLGELIAVSDAQRLIADSHLQEVMQQIQQPTANN